MDAAISVICLNSNALAGGEHPLMSHIAEERNRTMKSSGVSELRPIGISTATGISPCVPTASTFGGSF